MMQHTVSDMQELLTEQQEEDEVLRHLAGVQLNWRLQNLEEAVYLDIVVDTAETSISSLDKRMPKLRELKLNGSSLGSLRDLGSGLKHLQVLWVAHCGLTALEGLGALSGLRELYASFNQVDDMQPLADLEMLEVLDLEGNRVEDLGACCYLAWCGSLHHLTLAGNPVAEEDNYHSEVGSSWSCPGTSAPDTWSAELAGEISISDDDSPQQTQRGGSSGAVAGQMSISAASRSTLLESDEGSPTASQAAGKQETEGPMPAGLFWRKHRVSTPQGGLFGLDSDNIGLVPKPPSMPALSFRKRKD
eukprot:jgi/Astpho2/4096/Aster-01240